MTSMHHQKLFETYENLRDCDKFNSQLEMRPSFDFVIRNAQEKVQEIL
jgi:hypothetical protein